MRLARLPLVGVWVGLALCSSTPSWAQESTPLRVEDLLRIEEYAGATISPEGDWIAVVIRRPMSLDEVYRRDVLMRNDHADIWLFPRGGGAPRNLTQGAADASG
jgi:hypothetical protein